MKLSVDLAQAISRDVRVNLRRADARVAEQFLDHPQIRAVLQQMRCETVPQHVRSDVPCNPRAPGPIFNPQP